jgi:hypothetical protein
VWSNLVLTVIVVGAPIPPVGAVPVDCCHTWMEFSPTARNRYISLSSNAVLEPTCLLRAFGSLLALLEPAGCGAIRS